MNQRTYWNLPITVAAAASIVAILVGCGGTRAYAGVASGSAQQSPPTIGYKAYVSSQWLYSFDYPASWYELRDFGLPDVKYFANEQVDSPQRHGYLVSLRGLLLRFAFRHDLRLPPDG